MNFDNFCHFQQSITVNCSESLTSIIFELKNFKDSFVILTSNIGVLVGISRNFCSFWPSHGIFSGKTLTSLTVELEKF